MSAPQFKTDPQREAFQQEWRARIARGEDPTKQLTKNVESTPTSSFVEYWWRKMTRKERTIAEEKARKEERGEVGLLAGEEGQGSKIRTEQEEKRARWYGRVRWGA